MLTVGADRHNGHTETFNLAGCTQQEIDAVFAESKRYYLALCKEYGYRAREISREEGTAICSKSNQSSWAKAPGDMTWVGKLSGIAMYPKIE